MLLDVQFNPARVAWPELRELALAAEHGGYGAIWVFDHLAGMSMRGSTMLETFTLLGALAATTTTIELGSMVVNVHHRSPAVVAVAAASVEAIADRPVHLGLGAGAAPDSRWAAELRAIGQAVEPTVESRRARVAAVLDVLDRMYDPDRPAELATFPRWRHRSTVLLGANSRAMAELAGRRTDGVNVGWDHPRRDELLAVAIEARGRRDGFALTTWTTWSPELLDPEHPQRQAMDALGIDRAVLVVPDGVTPERLARRPRRHRA